MKSCAGRLLSEARNKGRQMPFKRARRGVSGDLLKRGARYFLRCAAGNLKCLKHRADRVGVAFSSELQNERETLPLRIDLCDGELLFRVLARALCRG